MTPKSPKTPPKEELFMEDQELPDAEFGIEDVEEVDVFTERARRIRSEDSYD